MIRKAKVLSLAVVAVLAVSVVAASGAAAADFGAEKAPVTLTGSQATSHVFTTDPGTVTCTTANFHGEATEVTTTQQTIKPTYEGCTLKTIFGNIAVTVNFNGCHYLFTPDGEVHINCPAEKNVVVSGPGCTVTVPPQTIANGVEYTNQGTTTTRDILVHATAAGIKYSYSGFTCGSGTNTTNGTYTGDTTLTGSSGGVHVGIWHTP